MAVEWTIALSICTAPTCSLKTYNAQAAATILGLRNNDPSISFVVQQITKIDAQGGGDLSYEVNGVNAGTDFTPRIGDTNHLAWLVDKARSHAPNSRVLLWVVSHGRTSGVIVSVPVGLGAGIGTGTKTIKVKGTVIDPTQHNGQTQADAFVSNNAGLAGGAQFLIQPNPSGASPTGMNAASIGTALKNKKVDLFYLQSCQAGTMDVLAQLAENQAALGFLASAADLPVPGAELKMWFTGLQQKPTMDHVKLADAITDALNEGLSQLPSSIAGFVPVTDVQTFCGDTDRWPAFRVKFEDLVKSAHTAITANTVKKADICAWLKDWSRRTESHGASVPLNEVISAFEQLLDVNVTACRQAHTALFPIVKNAGIGARDMTVSLLAEPQIEPVVSDVFEETGWSSFVRAAIKP